MKIAILGTGMVGQNIAAKLSSLKHEVTIGTRDPKATLARTEKDAMGNPPFKDWHAQNSGVKLATFAEAAAFGELAFAVLNGSGALAALRAAKDGLAGKILIDVSNPLDFSKGFPPSLTVCNTDSLGEQIQKELPQTKCVKTLNTTNAMLMVNPGALAGAEHTMFVCGNDADAKAKVTTLLQSFGWKDVIDLGDITNARGTEMILPIWVRLFGALKTPMFNFKVVR
jgi:hypothetical protein